MSEIIIQSRITPPKLQSNIIHRNRLLGKIKENSEKSLILLSAPAGYGKTTLIQDYFAVNKKEYSWFQLSPDIKSFNIFLTYLVNSLKRIDDNFGEYTLQLIESVKERRAAPKNITPLIDEALGTFVNEFSKSFNIDITIVIDDLSSLGSNDWLNYSFEKLLSIMPANLFIIITSREQPSFNSSILSAQRRIFELNISDLSFDFEETALLLKEIYGYNYSDSILKTLDDKINGWITGLHLLLQAYGKDYEKVISAKKNLPENIFHYFANEIFNKLDNKTQNFLIETAILNDFDNDVCNYLLNIKDAKSIITSLQKKNIFLEQVFEQTEKPRFNYQASFKQFLISKLKDTKSEKDIELLYKKVIGYYTNRNAVEEAIAYSLDSKLFDKTTELLKTNFDKLYNEGKIETLWKWLSLIDEEFISKDGSLLYYKGLLYKFFVSDVENALKYTDDAITLFEKEKSNTLLIPCYILRATILMNIGRTHEVLEDLLKLSEVRTINENKARLLYSIGYAYYINTQYKEAQSYLQNSLELSEKINLKDVKFDIYNILGNILLNQGDFIKSTHYFEQNYEKTANIDKRLLTVCNLIDLNAQAGKYDKAKKYLEQGRMMIEVFAVPIYNLILKISEARLWFEAGDYEETIKQAEELNTISKRFNRKYQTYFSYRLLSAAFMYLGNLTRADEYLKLANIYINEANQFQHYEFLVFDSVLKFKKNNNADIENNLLEAYKYFSENNFIYDSIQASYYLANYYFQNGSTSSALKHLEEVLKISSEKEYTSFFVREFLSSQGLFDFSISNKINKEYISYIKTSVLELQNLQWLSNGYKERLKSDLDKIYDVKVIVFGGLEFKVRGSDIPEENWKRKIRKLILAYLFLNPNRKITKDKIIDLFFHDTPIESVDNIFHQSISNIRSALNVNPPAETKLKAKSKKTASTAKTTFVNYEDKVLSLNEDYTYYIDAVSFNRLYNKFYSREFNVQDRINFAKEANEIYKGELLSGYYQNWCEDLRSEYSSKYSKMSLDFLTLLNQEKSYEEVIIYADKLSQMDKLNEGAYLHLIESYAKLENIGKAKDIFSKMLNIFENELGEKPSRATLDKIKNLLS